VTRPGMHRRARRPRRPAAPASVLASTPVNWPPAPGPPCSPSCSPAGRHRRLAVCGRRPRFGLDPRSFPSEPDPARRFGASHAVAPRPRRPAHGRATSEGEFQ
jgi:hypothetical protein